MKTKNSLKYLIVAATVGITFTACKKDRIEEDRSLNEYSSPNSYLDSKKQEEQEFIITADSGGPIVGNQFTTIWGGRQCLMFPNGDTVGLPYTIKLVELYTPKDMIYYQMPTVASDTILETDGEIRVRAFKDGTELMLVPGCSWAIKMPNSAPKNYMHTFYGFPTSNYVNWTDNPASLGVTTSFNPIFTTSSDGYLNSIVKLGWVNCGITRGGSTNHHLSFASTTDNLTNVAIFVYFPATKTVMQVFGSLSGSIPDGSSVKIVAIAVDGSGTLFSFNQNLTMTSSTAVEVTMAATTDANLTALLNGL
ncbi:MAG: hypothetical protein V4547_13280 [Bacteroidota bacterium]